MGDDNYWFNTSLRPRFFFMDIGALVAFPLFIFHMRMWTFYILIGCLVLFFFLERRGIRPMTLVRILLLRVGGMLRWPIIMSTPRYYKRRLENL